MDQSQMSNSSMRSRKKSQLYLQVNDQQLNSIGKNPSLKFSSSKTHLDIWQLDDIEALKSYYQDEYFKVLEEDKG